MEYTFDINQLEILNRLVFDASFDLLNSEDIVLTDSTLEFELERRAFENVTRKKSFFGTSTVLTGQTSTIRFENVDNLTIEGVDENSYNHFIDKILIDKEGKLAIWSRSSSVAISMTYAEKTKIYLKDIKASDFGRGTVGYNCGFTADEWSAFLKEKNYTKTDT